MPSLDKIKVYLIWAISIAVVTFFAYAMYIKNEKTILQFRLMQLEASNQVLVKQLQNSTEIIKKDKDQAVKLQAKIDDQDKIISIAKKRKDNDKPEQVIAKLKDSDEVVDKIKTLYNDSSTTYNSTSFMIAKNTTFELVYDAENWKTNSPIFRTKLNDLELYSSDLEKGIIVRDDQLKQKEIIIKDQDAREVLHNELDTNNRSQIDTLNKTLKIEKSNVIVKTIEGFFAGALLEWGREHYIKK